MLWSVAKMKLLAMASKIYSNSNILFTNINAFSSDTVEDNILETTNQFHIPGLTGSLVAFNINGNSMSPTIKTGDMVICQPLSSLKELSNNDIYAVVTNQSVWVKRVRKHICKDGRWTHLQLISDNFHEFEPFLVALNDIKRLLKVKHRLTELEKY